MQVPLQTTQRVMFNHFLHLPDCSGPASSAQGAWLLFWIIGVWAEPRVHGQGHWLLLVVQSGWIDTPVCFSEALVDPAACAGFRIAFEVEDR
jgi:hypothetical protein